MDKAQKLYNSEFEYWLQQAVIVELVHFLGYELQNIFLK
jgi:hypothetical protein